VNFDPAVGGEIRKQRPAIIVSNDASNKHLIGYLIDWRERVIVAARTMSKREVAWLREVRQLDPQDLV